MNHNALCLDNNTSEWYVEECMLVILNCIICAEKGEYIMEKEVLWNNYSAEQQDEMEQVCSRYMACLDEGKTERESARLTVRMAEEAGYQNLKDIIANGGTLKTGDKVYYMYNEKLLVMYHIGSDPLENGMNILGAHIDSPRMDVKQNPLYENNGFAYLDTHYYGGIKKYQWVTLPLAIHGVVIKKDGTKIDISIGEKDSDPVFTVTDLLIHLSQDQLAKTGAKVVDGEALDLLIGSIPSAESDSEDDKEQKKETVTANICRILEEQYGFEEEDFISAELEIVPAGRCRELGFDRSMIIGYGQDDRICAFTSLMALLDSETPKRTACCILVDKEEIGSVGASGMHSKIFENITAEILNCMGQNDNISLRRTLQNSKMLSSDVSAAFDPLYASVFEPKNAAFMGKGPVFNKFTGGRGKSSSSDANPEYIAEIRKLLSDHSVQFQTAEMGKVDVGGGGTIAYIMANYGMEVIDCGVAILCMHSPWEVSSKADVYETYRCYKAFIKDMK